MSRADQPAKAAFAVTIAVFAISIGDALIKLASADIGLWQLFILRSALAVPVLIVILTKIIRTVSVWPRSILWSVLRSLLITFSWVAYYASLPSLDLATAAAGYYTSPIFIMVLAALFAGEPIRTRQFIAIGLGFCGVLVVLQPQTDHFSMAALLPIVAALLYGAAMVTTRTKCRDEHPVVLSLALNFAFITVGIAAIALIAIVPSLNDALAGGFLGAEWRTLDRDGMVLIAVLAGLLIFASSTVAWGYQSGRSAMLATFDFSYVGFAALWGVLIFSTVPNVSTVIGICLIISAGFLAVSKSEAPRS